MPSADATIYGRYSDIRSAGGACAGRREGWTIIAAPSAPAKAGA